MSPRAFSEQEKQYVRQRLIEAAHDFLSTTGIRKTTVDSLCRAAGISKGAFYLFYESKELLFLDALELEQKRIHDLIIHEISSQDSKQEAFVSVISKMYREFLTRPWLISLSNDEYDILLRKILPQRIKSHIELDDASSKRMLDALQLNIDPELLSAMLRMLFMSILHHKEVGQYAEHAFDYTLKALAASLFGENRHD